MKFYTPLRYPGGKGKFCYFIKALLEKNNLVNGHYIEPYAGGAGIALELLQLEFVTDVHINDIDPAVYSFWHSVLNEPEALCRKILETEVSIAEWHRQKEILNSSENSLALGFATFFLNRTNRSGILKAGVIGGKSQEGKWKLDVRFNKTELVQRIKNISERKSRIHLYNLDAISFLNTVLPLIPQRSLIYLDPPYYVKGQGLYRNFYEHKDHVEIRDYVTNVLDKNWLVSYDNCTEIRDIYKGHRMFDYALQYTAQDKKVGSELMVVSNGLNLPDITIGKPVAA